MSTTTNQQGAHPVSIPVFYNQGYFCAGYGVDTREKARDIAESLAVRPIKGIVLADPAPAAREQLLMAHGRVYVDALLTGRPGHIADRNGLGPWSTDLRESVLLSTGGVIDAVQYSLRTGSHAGSLSSGLHHARKDSGSGFCTVNGLVVAARTAVAEGAVRVLILDLDAHCGGGTASLIKGVAGIEQVDVAVSAFDSYPVQDNSAVVMSSDASYLRDICGALEGVEDPGSISVVIYNAGMDPHEDCTTGGARGITTGVLAERERMVFDWANRHGLPIAFVLAGGYSGRALSRERLVDLHRLTIAAATL